MRIDSFHCNRCGQDHKDVEFRQLSGERRGIYWALCPVTGEPVLLRVEALGGDEYPHRFETKV